MSYTSQQKKRSPGGMGLALAVNGSIIAAIMLSPMMVEPATNTPRTTIFDVDRDPPPPPDQPIKEAKTTPKLDPAFQPKTITDPIFEQKTITTTTKDNGPIEIALNGNSDSVREVIRDVVPPKPIFRAAQRDPRFARNFQPDYPPGLLQKEVEGTAVVRVLIDANGRVRQAMVVSASHPDFGRAAEKQALREWRFKPATRDGVAVEDWQTLTVRFDITT